MKENNKLANNNNQSDKSKNSQQSKQNIIVENQWEMELPKI